MGESNMPAKIWAGQGKSCFRFWQKRKPRAFDNSVCNTLYHRADLAEPLVEALRIISGRQQCIDNLMSNADVAEAALQAYEAEQ